jgi:hypothetical protein
VAFTSERRQPCTEQTLKNSNLLPVKRTLPRTIETLVQAAKPGMWVHERDLCLAIAKGRTAFWAPRYSTKSGQRRLMTLEACEAIDTAQLKALERQVAEFRKQIRAVRDPLAERNAVATNAVAKMLFFDGHRPDGAAVFRSVFATYDDSDPWWHQMYRTSQFDFSTASLRPASGRSDESGDVQVTSHDRACADASSPILIENNSQFTTTHQDD